MWWSFPITNVAIAMLSVCRFVRGGWRSAPPTTGSMRADWRSGRFQLGAVSAVFGGGSTPLE
jgi:hypothetical protein